MSANLLVSAKSFYPPESAQCVTLHTYFWELLFLRPPTPIDLPMLHTYLTRSSYSFVILCLPIYLYEIYHMCIVYTCFKLFLHTEPRDNCNLHYENSQFETGISDVVHFLTSHFCNSELWRLDENHFDSVDSFLS